MVPLLVSFAHPSPSLSSLPCDIVTIITSTGVLTTHLWTITLAIITYVGLVRPLGTALTRAEHAWFGIGLGIYAVAAGVSVGLWGIGGSTYVGGHCAFVSNLSRTMHGIRY
jgi:hypothetical protein